MANDKKVSLVIVIAVVIGAVWYLYNSSAPAQQPVTQTQNKQAVIDKIGTTPLTIIGVVSKIDGQNITVKVGTEEKVIIIGEKTMMIKQTRENEIIKTSPATIDDVKLKLRLIVAYKQSSEAGYMAENISIIDF